MRVIDSNMMSQLFMYTINCKITVSNCKDIYTIVKLYKFDIFLIVVDMFPF